MPKTTARIMVYTLVQIRCHWQTVGPAPPRKYTITTAPEARGRLHPIHVFSALPIMTLVTHL